MKPRFGQLTLLKAPSALLSLSLLSGLQSGVASLTACKSSPSLFSRDRELRKTLCLGQCPWALKGKSLLFWDCV